MLLKALLLACLLGSAIAVKLDQYNVDQHSITVSGLSSGGAMAMQYHIAFSSYIKGAGVLAGLPYGCANAGLVGATQCMSYPAATNVNKAINLVNSEFNAGKIDNPTNLGGSNVFVFTGTKDTTVKPANGQHVQQVYANFGVNVQMKTDLGAVHGFPTDFYGAACGSSSALTQYINNCDYHGAFHTMNYLYNGSLTAPSGSETLQPLLQYEQAEFGGNAASSMDGTGYIYIPSGCVDKTKKCRLHISLHGCQQYRSSIGDVYATKTGYLQAGEKNDIIVIFPQAAANILNGNPNGCWDWWGYLNANFVNKNGAQMTAINKMIQRVAYCDGNSNCFPDDATQEPATTTTTAPQTGPTTTKAPGQCEENNVSFHPFPTDCSYYTLCACQAQVLLQCAAGLFFDTSINNCNFQQLVNCEGGVRP